MLWHWISVNQAGYVLIIRSFQKQTTSKHEGTEEQMELTSLTFAFVKELADFAYKLSVMDRVWNILFPDQGKKWNYLHVNKYKHTFYITHIDGNGGSIEVEPNKCVRAMASKGDFSCCGENPPDQPVAVWEPLITSACKWLKVVRKDWIKANKRVQSEYPVLSQIRHCPQCPHKRLAP